jgi:hypothetical protein
MTKEVENTTRIGRPKGSLNARTVDLFEIAQELDCNPFKILLMYAKGDSEGLGLTETEKISLELRQKSAKDACEYLFPKRKAIEHSGPDGENLFVEFLKGLNGSRES